MSVSVTTAFNISIGFHRSNISVSPFPPPFFFSPPWCSLQRKGDDGEMYTGLGDGRVVRLDPNGENPQTVFFTGSVVSAAGRAVGSATGVDFGNQLVHKCHDKVHQ